MIQLFKQFQENGGDLAGLNNSVIVGVKPSNVTSIVPTPDHVVRNNPQTTGTVNMTD